MDDLTLTGAGIVLAAAAAVLATLGWRGVFSRRAFDAAPPRRGRLGLVDLFVGVGMVLLGIGIAGLLLVTLVPPPPDALHGLLWELLAGQFAAIPAIAYILVRASTAVEGGIDGFGLAARALPRGILLALLGTLAIIPLLGLTGIIVNVISFLLGQQTPRIAHDLLRVIAEAPWGVPRWGLILSAVLIAPFVEEIIFRGLVQTSLLQSPLIRGRWTAIFITSALFVLVHVGVLFVPAEEADPPGDEPALVLSTAHEPHAARAEGAPALVLARAAQAEPRQQPVRFAWQALPVLLVLSIALGYAYERTGNLWVPIGIHALFNAIQVAIAIASPQGG